MAKDFQPTIFLNYGLHENLALVRHELMYFPLESLLGQIHIG